MVLGEEYFRFWWELPTTPSYFYIEYTDDLDGGWSAFDFGDGDNYITDFTPVAVATPSRLVFLGGNIDGNRYLTGSSGSLEVLPNFPSVWRNGSEYTTVIPLQVERDPDTGLLVAMVQANDLLYVYPRFLMVSDDEGDSWTLCADANETHLYTGLIDEVQLHSRVRTMDEIVRYAADFGLMEA